MKTLLIKKCQQKAKLELEKLKSTQQKKVKLVDIFFAIGLQFNNNTFENTSLGEMKTCV